MRQRGSTLQRHESAGASNKFCTILYQLTRRPFATPSKMKSRLCKFLYRPGRTSEDNVTLVASEAPRVRGDNGTEEVRIVNSPSDQLTLDVPVCTSNAGFGGANDGNDVDDGHDDVPMSQLLDKDNNKRNNPSEMEVDEDEIIDIIDTECEEIDHDQYMDNATAIIQERAATECAQDLPRNESQN